MIRGIGLLLNPLMWAAPTSEKIKNLQHDVLVSISIMASKLAPKQLELLLNPLTISSGSDQVSNYCSQALGRVGGRQGAFEVFNPAHTGTIVAHGVASLQLP